MLKRIVRVCILVLMVAALSGCAKKTEPKMPQTESIQENNILDSFIIEERGEEEEEKERITLSLDDLKKKPRQEESSEEAPEEEPQQDEPEEESGAEEGGSHEYYRGQVAGDSDLGDPIEFDVEMTPVFDGSDNAE